MVARLALGTAQWGMRYGIANRTGQPARAELERMLALAEASGVTTLDTARAYGESEQLLGELLRGSTAFRIVTKVSPDVLSGGEEGVGPARDRTRASVERSLTLLGGSRLDTVLLHRGEHVRRAGGAAWAALGELRAEGTIHRIGVSATSVAEALFLIEVPGVEVLQVPASLLDRRLVGAGFFSRARERGVEVFVRSVLLQGAALLSPDELPVHLSPLAGPLRTIAALAAEARVSPVQVWLAYARARLDGVLLLGCETLEQLDENLRACAVTGPPQSELEELVATLAEVPERLLDPALWGREG